MKILLTILILILSFQSWTKANDVKEFEIEGMSVGDSLLDYFSRTKIKEFINHDSSYSYANGDYVIIGLSKSNQNSVDLNTYQNLGITIKKSDRQYEIKSIAGQSYTFANIKECNNKQKKVSEEIKKDLLEKNINVDIWENDKWMSGGIVVGKSIMHDFYFDNKSAVRIICYELNEDGKKMANWEVKLDVIINSSEFNQFLIKK